MKKNLKLLVPILFLAFLSGNLFADVKLPKIFSSNMVLQQGIEIAVWGWADRNESITVSMNGTTVKTKAGKNGSWSVRLPAMDYGGPHTLTVKGKNMVEFTDVLIGEVWICSGQSNMAWTVKNSNDPETEIASADYPQIRLFQVPLRMSEVPLNDIEEGEWKVCTPGTIPDFSAVAWFFGRELHKKLNVPVGLIQTAWGGTVAETWISAQTIKNDPDFAGKLQQLKDIDIAKEAEMEMKRVRELLGGDLPRQDLGIVDDVPVWAAIDLNDSDWRTIKVPGVWEDQGYDIFNGAAYYRCEIILSPEQSSKNAVLHLGMVDDDDITWMNGIEIGQTNGHNVIRQYFIKSEVLRPGKNVLTVRAFDKGGLGGIWGDAGDQYLLIGDEKLDLPGEWKFRFGRPFITRGYTPNAYPTLLFNSMIHPLIPYGIKGAIWYQGESNANRALQYQRIFPALINDWRSHWKLGDFSFIWVQLANYKKPADEPGESTWAELREAQTMTLKLPKTGMASAIDIGEANDIHPRNKQDVGKRLALNALKIEYGKDVVHQGPMFSSVKFIEGKAYVTFDCTGSGLKVNDRYGYINGFTIAGADGKFYWAKARIASVNQVEVYSDEVPEPVAVRYGWADNPDDLNLYNKEGLPANPFRTR